jgi:hypothetical protein
MSSRSFFRLLAITMVAAASAAAQQAPAPKPGGAAVVNVTAGTAVVMYVDVPTRNVTVKINGQLHNYTLSDSMKGIMNIKQGDTVHLEIVQELAVYLKVEDQPPVGTAAEMMTLQPKGRPAMHRVMVNELKGTITKLDYGTRIMSIVVPPKMDTMTFIADTSLHDLHAMKPGDHVVMRYTRGIVVTVLNK